MINVGDVIGRLTVLERGETHIYKNGAKDTEHANKKKEVRRSD